MTMREYRNTKIERYGNEMSAYQVYGNLFLPVYLICSNLNLLWNFTVVGYADTKLFLLELGGMMLALIAFLTINLVDIHTFVSNLLFILYFMVKTVLSAAGTLGQSAQTALGDSVPVMQNFPAEGLGMAEMGMMASEMGGLFPPEQATTEAVLGSFGDMLKNKLLQIPFLAELFANPQVGVFFTVFACEICIVACLFYMVYLISNHKLFFSSLHHLSEQEAL